MSTWWLTPPLRILQINPFDYETTQEPIQATILSKTKVAFHCNQTLIKQHGWLDYVYFCSLHSKGWKVISEVKTWSVEVFFIFVIDADCCLHRRWPKDCGRLWTTLMFPESQMSSGLWGPVIMILRGSVWSLTHCFSYTHLHTHNAAQILQNMFSLSSSSD